MKLHLWLSESCMTDSEFARQVGTTSGSVRNWKSGKLPQDKFLTRIRKLTEGKVDTMDFPFHHANAINIGPADQSKLHKRRPSDIKRRQERRQRLLQQRKERVGR